MSKTPPKESAKPKVPSGFETTVPKDGRVKFPEGIFGYKVKLHGEWDGTTLTLRAVGK